MLSIADSTPDYAYDVLALADIMFKVDDDLYASCDNILTMTSFANVKMK